jgi:hypothetical protein
VKRLIAGVACVLILLLAALSVDRLTQETACEGWQWRYRAFEAGWQARSGGSGPQIVAEVVEHFTGPRPAGCPYPATETSAL